MKTLFTLAVLEGFSVLPVSANFTLPDLIFHLFGEMSAVVC
jgi:hypothetical protein